MRIEKDSIGEMKIAKNSYTGIHTERAQYTKRSGGCKPEQGAVCQVPFSQGDKVLTK